MPITTGLRALASDFINRAQANATPANDEGRVVKLEDNGKIDQFFNSFFGVSAYQNAGVTYNSTLTIVPLQVENFDTNGYHDNSVNNSRFTVPAGLGGIYLIVGNLHSTASSPAALSIRKNGSDILGAGAVVGVGTLSQGGISIILELAATDYIEMAVQTGGGTLSTSGNERTKLTMYRISA